MRDYRLSVSLVLLGATATVTATSIRVVNLSEMVDSSNRVFRGRCIAVTETTHSNGLPVVEYQFFVSEGMKGTTEGEEVVFRQLRPGGTGGHGGVGILGLPAYRKGQDAVIFLAPDSRIGLTSPIGFAQGVFDVHEDARAQATVLNGFGNRNLLRGLDATRLLRMGFKHSEVDLLRVQGPVLLETLSQAVRRIDDFQARRASKPDQ